MTTQEVIKSAISIGRRLLENGAEIYRVEESIRRICFAYGVESVDIYAIPSNIIVSVLNEKGEFFTQNKQIFPNEIDLNKVDKLNNLSRFICKNKPKFQEINEKILEIDQEKGYNQIIISVCYFVISAVFALFFKGNLYDAFCSGIIGLMIKYMLDILLKYKTNTVFTNIICSFFGSVLAILFTKIGLGENYDKIIIGTIMLLVPGLVLTNAMRDFITGDLVTGISRLIEAILIAVGIAIGVIFALSIFNISGKIGG